MNLEKDLDSRVELQRHERQKSMLRQVNKLRLHVDAMHIPQDIASFAAAEDYFRILKSTLKMLLAEKNLPHALAYEIADLVQVVDAIEFSPESDRALTIAHLGLLKSMLPRVEQALMT